MKITIDNLKEGRNYFDRLQKNLTSIITSTDVELTPRLEARNEMASMFGGECGQPLDCEGLREESRKMQDDLDRQGREAFAREYADSHGEPSSNSYIPVKQ